MRTIGRGVSKISTRVGGGWASMTLAAEEGQTSGRVSAFRLRGSLVPRNGRAIYLRDRQGCRNFTRSKGDWDRSPLDMR